MEGEVMCNGQYVLVNPSDVMQLFIYCRSNPTYEIIRQLCDCCEIDVTDEEVFHLYSQYCSLDRGDLFLDVLFSRIRDNEEADEGAVRLAVTTLNSVYHTRLYRPVETAGRLKDDYRVIIGHFRNDRIIDAVEIITNINTQAELQNHTYSFASKFCSFMDEMSFPIFDKYSSNMIYTYLKMKSNSGENVRYKYKKYLGIPDYFLGAYNEFIDLYELENNYKNVDIFLWMYGKMLELKKLKNFDMVSYISLENRRELAHYPVT